MVQAVANGTIAKLEKEYNVSSDQFPCEMQVASGSDSVLIDMVSGVIIFSALFIIGGTVWSLFAGLTYGRTGRVFSAFGKCKAPEMPQEEEEEAAEEVETAEVEVSEVQCRGLVDGARQIVADCIPAHHSCMIP